MSETTVKEPEKKEKEETKPEYTKEQQALDQERANAKRAREETEELADNLEQATNKIAELERQVAASKAAVTEKKDEIDKLDPSLYDPKLIRNFERMVEKQARLEKEILDLKNIADTYKQQADVSYNERKHREMEEKILSTCDDEFGAKFRNEAVKMADKLTNDGDVERPNNSLDGYLLMKRCYQEVRKQTEKKTVAATDTGGGSVPVNETESKPGTFSQVLDDLKKNPRKWKTT